MDSKHPEPQERERPPLQRRTTLKWGENGELSPVDMARVLDKLSNPELTECDLACEVDADSSQ